MPIHGLDRTRSVKMKPVRRVTLRGSSAKDTPCDHASPPAANAERGAFRRCHAAPIREIVHQVFHLQHVPQVRYPPFIPTKEQLVAELMQVREAARTLGVSENTVRRWEERGLLHAVRLPSGVRRFRPAEIEAVRARMYEGLPPLVQSDDIVSVSEATPID